MNLLFPGVFRDGARIYTVSLDPGSKVYGEDTIKQKGDEYRSWNPWRSKLGAALSKGLKFFPFKDGAKVMYLGAASGTTVSHVSDLVGAKGMVYCVEFSAQVARDLIALCERRPNMLPLVEDARSPENYEEYVEGKVDVVYEDVADREQARILIENCAKFLRPQGFAMIAIKARSIDSSAPPQKIYSQVISQLRPHFDVVQQIDLRPFDIDHLFVVLRKK